MEPRFIGSESTNCVAALQPNIFSGHGDEELRRYLRGAAERHETALLISMIGESESESRNPLTSYDATVNLPGLQGHIAGRRLPQGAAGTVAQEVQETDRDLALRLLNRRDDAPWWAIEPASTEAVWGDGSGRTTIYEPDGEFIPIVVNTIGETLAGVWVPASEDWRWYIIPYSDEWRTLIEWLVARAIPEYVPDALRRTQAAEVVDEQLLTPSELSARRALALFDDEARTRRADLEKELAAVRKAADGTRFGLLYGTGRRLVLVVKHLLDQTGFIVQDLDESSVTTNSADLLVSKNDLSWLVEVKSTSGNPSEDLVGDVERHIRTWPQLGRAEALQGGVLIINHQHRQAPLARQTQPFTRREFVETLPCPVLSTVAMFKWWRDGELTAIEEAITGPPRQYGVDWKGRDD